MEVLLGQSFDEKVVTGAVKVEHLNGKSVATRVFARYPLKLMLPTKVASSKVDVLWVYAIGYGGGIVSGDIIDFKVDVAAACTVVLTTQSSTKVFKSLEGRQAEQGLKASVGSGALLAVLPDPVTCFAAARFSQVQTFNLAADGNLILLDWLTSGRRERGEIWAFDSYRSRNHIYLGQSGVLMLDNVCLEQGAGLSVEKRMYGFHVLAMLTVYGPRLTSFRMRLRDKTQLLAKQSLNRASHRIQHRIGPEATSLCEQTMFISSCHLGSKDEGILVRIAAKTTEAVYDFLREEFGTITDLIGALPFAGR